MPRRSRQARRLLQNEPPPKEFDARLLFPEHKKVPNRGPLPKQELIFDWTERGICRGGGIVFQGSLYSSKTLLLVTHNIWCHQRWPGLRSVVGRETYVAMLNSTYDEYTKVLERMPPHFIESHSAPTINSAGYLHWANGGVTIFLSLGNIETLQSANLGLLSVDEGHLQGGEDVDKIAQRCRQTNGTDDDYPCIVLICSNPAGRSYFWKWANPKSPTRRKHWAWVESSIFDNPTLAEHYKERLFEMYPPGSLGYKRWVQGKSTQIEGIAFECFDEDPEAAMNVIPDFPIPLSYARGRGIDHGVVDPTVCIWYAVDHSGLVYVYRRYGDAGLAWREHARRIADLEKNDPPMKWIPAAPDMFRRVIPVQGQQRVFRTVAEEFREEGVKLTIADNDRLKGFAAVMEILAPSKRLVHPVHMTPPCPRLMILQNDSTQPLIDSIASMERCERPKSGNVGARDDVKQVDDHDFDALRYGIMAIPRLGAVEREPIRHRQNRRRGTQGYAGR